ncbi:MAG TPA: hypothetical protein VFO05_03430 [Candidatus Limnocylindrales bacterium]|nr:hypothetical protein [Candidatus Limnocylindrales bacterium]
MKRLALLALTGLLAIGLVLPAAAAAAPPARNALLNDIPVTGILENGDPFAGTLDITQVTRDGSTLLFDGALTDNATGDVTEFTDLAGTLQQGGGQARCDILLLDLGPLHLDVLGLVVDLSEINLDIHAVPGAGNLLGNLLCAVAGLLDGPLGGGLGGLLDRLLDAINDLLNDLLG